jgi:polysaccharide export outer membrane protein
MLFCTCLLLFPCAAESQPVPSEDIAPADYIVGPNDILSIFVWKEPDLTQEIIVMPDGRITFPMAGEVMARGKTVMELQYQITEKLSDYLTAPEVTVILRESRSRWIYTIGQVNHPGPYVLEPDTSVLQALSMAGGFAEWADQKQILIVRRQDNKELFFLFNYKEYISGKNLEQNILLQPNDTIIVP